MILWPKRGKDCAIGKLVVARPLGCLVYATPYRHRQVVVHASIPPQVLAYAKAQGARWWVIRLDVEGEAYGLSLSEVERTGWLATSEDLSEWFIPLASFQAIPWQEWRYITETVTLGKEPVGRQLAFPGLLAGAGP